MGYTLEDRNENINNINNGISSNSNSVLLNAKMEYQGCKS